MRLVTNSQSANVCVSFRPTFLRSTAYHSVEASLGPWIRCHGRSGMAPALTTPASPSWRRVAT